MVQGAFKAWDKSAVSSSCRGNGLKDGRAGHVILIAGAAGAIGSHAAVTFRHRGDGARMPAPHALHVNGCENSNGCSKCASDQSIDCCSTSCSTQVQLGLDHVQQMTNYMARGASCRALQVQRIKQLCWNVWRPVSSCM